MRRTALITGSAKGIGKAILLSLAKKDFDVWVHYRHSESDAKQTQLEAQQMGVSAKLVQADLSDPSQLFAEIGNVDVLVNNVGNYLVNGILQTSAGNWKDMLDSNLNTPVLLSQQFLTGMLENHWGRIINLGYAGVANPVARPNASAYIIAKTALWQYTKTLAQAVAHEGITVNMVSPGVAENSISKPLDEIPMRRTATLEEICSAVNYFIDQPYLTGQNLEVSGGWNL